MNNVYLKGFGDSEPEYTPEPTDEQIIRAPANMLIKVAQNAVDSFRSDFKDCTDSLANYDDNDAVTVRFLG